ncbi:hypothetical protein LTR86_004861 [Recurvomyces mirabilis]|nr:hypothetical protein LTR86_004861 [Recurvomyces mirabilis]
MQNPEVIIIGGGLGGLSLANGLYNKGISYHVFERDRTEHYRAQGYRIRIGGPAIDSLDYLLTAQAMARFNLSCADFSMHPIPEIDAESAKVSEPNVPMPVLPEGMTWSGLLKKARCVDRAAMREVLIKSIPTEHISYDKVFTHYEEMEDGTVKAFFRDGTTAIGSLLVGADGRSSHVRQQLLPDLNIEDCGGMYVYGKTYITPELMKELPSAALNRMSFIKDRAHQHIVIGGLEPISFSNATERQASGLSVPRSYIFWAMAAAPEALGFPPEAQIQLTPDESAKHMLELSEHWHPSIRAVIEQQAPSQTCALKVTIVNKDFGTNVWESNKHITVLGDAVHPMAATGSGAVTALMDARSICEGLVRRREAEKDGVVSPNDYKEMITTYEATMRKNAGEAVIGSWIAMKNAIGMKRGESEVHMGEMAMKIRQKNMMKTM